MYQWSHDEGAYWIMILTSIIMYELDRTWENSPEFQITKIGLFAARLGALGPGYSLLGIVYVVVALEVSQDSGTTNVEQ
jgi:hypothetical protein